MLTFMQKNLNYTRYLNEETEYITMHKTKGTSIPSVIVVMEEYFWNEYDFSLIHSQSIEGKSKKRNDSQKSIYVACSRAKNNLICIRVLVKVLRQKGIVYEETDCRRI